MSLCRIPSWARRWLQIEWEIPLAVGETIGEFKAVIRLDTFHADPSAGIPLEQLFQKIRGGVGGLFRVSSQETQTGKLVNSSVLV